MDLISLLVILICVSLVLWSVTTYLPIPEPMKTVIVVVVALACLVYVLRYFL